ncbi:MAG: hypothetical protein IIB28_05825, partial [Chloroflexi bacterium]|nr:hypothetical protein [Chloroflexota bacterium]
EDLIDCCDYLPTMLDAAGITPPDEYFMDGQTFLPQLKGEAGNPRDWIYFHFEPMSGRSVRPPARFIRDKKWKLYDDGRMFDITIDNEEENALLAESDNDERAKARAALEPVIARMVK